MIMVRFYFSYAYRRTYFNNLSLSVLEKIGNDSADKRFI